MINKDNFMLIAMKAYDNPSCKTIVEFEEDLAKFSNLVRLASKDAGEIESRIFMNASMTLFNVFELSECIKLMFFKVKRHDWGKLKSVLLFLHRMPHSIPELGVYSEDIEECKKTTEILEKI